MKGWNWDGFWGYFINPYLLEGAIVTIALTATALVLGLVVGLLLAVMRMSAGSGRTVARRWLNTALAQFAQVYIWVFRGTPLLVQLVIIYTGLPQISDSLRLDVTQSAVLGLVLNESAYLSEIVRAGISAVSKGQREAALSLGLSRWRAFRLVVWPQAMRIIIPPLGNSVNGLLKATSIVSVISMEELMRRGQILMQERFQVLEIFIVVAVLYLGMTTAWELVQRRIEAHYGRGFGDAALRSARDDR
ncbi:MAG: amino acid ABC transporter permease [Phreatobacter sp.]|uniref:amino acid ABC transporter permease n=1 Tax=Phreatobacter sp. TaxID=1966341 RepID=UPI001A3F4A55|nr:amino acid ABC transporter permease [Phreatobacter sp.]MBL8571827.1 amino acid ABC transporter permease [Phreatobacter sp.]